MKKGEPPSISGQPKPGRQKIGQFRLIHGRLRYFFTQIFDRYLFFLQFVPGQDQRQSGAGFIRFFELAFETAAAAMAQYAHTGQAAAQFFRQRQTAPHGGFAAQRQIGVWRVCIRHGGKVTQLDQTLQPQGKADRRRRPGAMLPGQVIVAATRAGPRPGPRADP